MYDFTTTRKPPRVQNDMNAFITAVLLVLGALAGALTGCDSNPTPHPAGDARTYDVAEAGQTNGGRGDDLSPEPGPGEDDPDNAATDGEWPAAGFEGCDTMADGEVLDGGDGDVAAGDQADAGDGVTLLHECGPSEVTSGASNDNVDRVE